MSSISVLRMTKKAFPSFTSFQKGSLAVFFALLTLQADPVFADSSFMDLPENWYQTQSLPRFLITRTRLKMSAQNGNLEAKVRLGDFYLSGRNGFAKNPDKAIQLYAEATRNQYPAALSRLGFLRLFGYAGLQQDYGLARVLFELSAHQNDPSGQAHLGYMCWRGLGGQRNPEEGLRLIRLAAERGDSYGQNYLGYAYERGIAGVLPVDLDEAVRLYRLSAEQGNLFGQNSLARMYRRGVGGLERNDTEAARLYRLSANQGSSVGQFNLGFMYLNGLGGLELDPTEAAKLFRLSSENGYTPGHVYLGVMYYRGWGGLERDEDRAISLFRLAANQGDREGQYWFDRLTRVFPLAREVHITQEEDCTICQEPFFGTRGKIEVLPCSHKYHSQCLKGWERAQQGRVKTCPECRMVIPEE